MVTTTDREQRQVNDRLTWSSAGKNVANRQRCVTEGATEQKGSDDAVWSEVEGLYI